MYTDDISRHLHEESQIEFIDDCIKNSPIGSFITLLSIEAITYHSNINISNHTISYLFLTCTKTDR